MVPDLTRLWKTTTFRLILAIASVLMLAMTVLLGALYWVLAHNTLAPVVQNVTSQHARLVAQLKDALPPDRESVIAQLSTVNPAGVYLLTRSDGQTPAAGTLPGWPVELVADGRLHAVDGTPETSGTRQNGGAPIVAIGTRFANGQRLLVGEHAFQQQALTQNLKLALVTGFVIFLAVAVGSGMLIARLVMRRIQRIASTSERFMQGALTERVPRDGTGDELDNLSATLNAMFDRIAQLMDSMREVSDNIAHDLKTPLNRLRLRAEAALDEDQSNDARREALEAVLIQTDDIIRTFNALLQVARLDAGVLDQPGETFDLSELVSDIVELYEPVAEEAGAVLDHTAGPPIRLTAQRQLIGQATTNLIENALKYGVTTNADPVAKPHILVEIQRRPTDVVIRVADHGPGIPHRDRDRAMERFVRLDASRTKPGTGLGLSLVSAVARGHGGCLKLDDNAPGLCADLHLPNTLRDPQELGSTCNPR